MPPEGVAFLTAITLVGGFVLLYPVVRALAERIRGRGDAVASEEMAQELQQLRGEVDELRRPSEQLSELTERVDFLERLVAKQREAERLPPVR